MIRLLVNFSKDSYVSKIYYIKDSNAKKLSKEKTYG